MALIKLKAFVVPVINSSVTESIKLGCNESSYKKTHLFTSTFINDGSF